MKLPAAITERLRSEYGLDDDFLASPGSLAAVQCRMRKIDDTDEAAYFDKLCSCHDEFDAFVDELLVPESWFFRDRAPFEFLARWVTETWKPKAEGRTLRVLSVPCANGPEPYSIAMTLIDAGLPLKSFRVYAGDISKQNLERARKAEYRKMAFRGRDASGRQHHFEKIGDGFRVCEQVRGSVSFKHCNLLVGGSLAFAPSFDVIFCRNVLIYLRAEARTLVIGNLLQLLTPDGLLFVGHADGLPMLSQAFEPAGSAGTFCFRRRQQPTPETKPAPRPRRRATRPAMPKARQTALPAKTGSAVVRHTPASSTVKETSLLNKAAGHADKGELDAARQACLDHLQDNAPTADALFLLGQVEMASSRFGDAEACIRKALYLNPNHHDALVQMALLAERRGAGDEAKRLRQRARKLEANAHG